MVGFIWVIHIPQVHSIFQDFDDINWVTLGINLSKRLGILVQFTKLLHNGVMVYCDGESAPEVFWGNWNNMMNGMDAMEVYGYDELREMMCRSIWYKKFGNIQWGLGRGLGEWHPEETGWGVALEEEEEEGRDPRGPSTLQEYEMEAWVEMNLRNEIQEELEESK